MGKAKGDNRIKNVIIGVIIAVFAVIMAILEWVPISFSKDTLHSAWIGKILQQSCGIVAMVCLLWLMRIKVCAKPQKWLYLLPCLAISVNNFQWWSYCNGLQTFARSDALDFFLFAGYCLSVGVFEEFVFRGILFSVLAGCFPRNKKGLIETYVVSSLVFALAHIFNGNLLQVLYTVLTGGLFGFVLIKTKNLLCCGFIHGLYNFCGLLMDTEKNLGLGNGIVLFNWGTVLTMGLVAVLMIAFVLYSLYKYPETEQKTLYQRLAVPEKKEKTDNEKNTIE